MRTKWLLVGACLVLPITTIADQLNIRPGLWEMTSTTHTSGMPPLPKSMMDNMTPAQRAEMEASMKAEAAKGPQTETERQCITKEDIENPFDSETEGCTHTIVTTTRTTQELRLTCTGDVRGSGVMRITTPTPESMSGVLDLKMGLGSERNDDEGAVQGSLARPGLRRPGRGSRRGHGRSGRGAVADGAACELGFDCRNIARRMRSACAGACPSPGSEGRTP